MKKKLFLTSLFSFLTVDLMVLPQKASAEITNKLTGNLGSNAGAAENGSIFTGYFINIWRALIVIGTIALLFNLVNGAFDWILAGGDASKIQKGRDKMIQSIIGMIVLATSFIFISYLSNLLFSFDLLNLTIPKPN